MKAYTTHPELFDFSILKRVIVIVIVSMLALISCGSTKMVTQTVRDVSVDTIYLSNTQYDSIYIYKDRMTDRSKDTVYLKDVSVEYRYKLLRDTVRIVERDSIPYEVTVIKTQEIARPLTWYDHFSRAVLWLNIGFAIYWLIRLFRRFHKP